MPTPQPDPPTEAQNPWRWLHAALMPDYNPRATAYWWSVLTLGSLALGLAVAGLAGVGPGVLLQVGVGCAIAMLAGLFPVRIPGSRNSFAAGELFIMLLLLLHGPAAAALAAAGEALVGATRTSKRWTSRLISPATACLSMMLTGSAFQAATDALGTRSAVAEALVLLLAMTAAIGHFLLNTSLISLVPQLKRNEPLRWNQFVQNFGWVGTTYAASALLAGLLYLVFKASGVGVMAAAVPIIIALLVMLHYHFRQRESDEKAHAQRIEAAEREAAQSARHLQQLRESERRFHSAFSHAAIGMALVSADGRVLQANPALAQLLGCGDDDLTSRDFKRHVHRDDLPLLERQWRGLVEAGAARQQADGPDPDTGPEAEIEVDAAAVELRCLRADGSAVTVAVHSGHFADRHASEPCLILQVQDISARREAEAKLQHIAYHDGLTSLANRIRFGDCLAQAIARSKRDAGYGFAVMYLDFDRFKLINDTLGHSAGDRFLTMVAQRIREAVRPGDTVGRLGGDEFAILIDGMADEAPTLAMADRLQRMLAEPYLVDGTEVNSSASIGITFSTVGYDTPGDVLRDADIAMYRAKSAGRARTALFDASLRAQLAAQVNLERDLRRAIEQAQLALAFQPIYDLSTGRIDSFEALVRWDHPELGAVPPATFIPIAEDAAMISPLTDWVLASACQRLREFQRLQGQGARPRLHVNVSGTDMCRGNFVSRVSTALLANGLEPGQLTLEITESTLMHRLDAALQVMAQLREIGVGLSVDDFGTGYSSLSYLSTLPITSLKIDRSFVQRLNADAKDAEVVRAVLTLGHALGKTVIAEGIETPEQLAQLRRMGCQFGQGYLLARPLTPEMAAAVVQADRLRDALGATEAPRPDANGATSATSATSATPAAAEPDTGTPGPHAPLALH
ncbi:putative bifunctional diguanylate cyclase/phosphodiesterase [Aquabacterium sp. OR-4]|uniref:putative bifunctional diguanylate cyclase/phosphodiesterase n=1 Tax=Aquabacterium sp. OR-4 TaxID=2978127 RepID=UPI0021B2DA15|nr:GGDEF and EAL domain-containing protein [Aquabacterium sp. OR-4]MDT7834615.1 EAL domain-containing protein [Aquabacterium sp. OR-4]